MWGGVKARKHYGDQFRDWSATRGLDALRRTLYQEPRPWFLAFSLHQRRHLLQDHHCARLMAWCATIVQLRVGKAEKQEAYRYAQETFGMLTHSHKAGRETMLEFLRLCAIGKDLTTAYEWHKFWLDSKKDTEVAASRGAALLEQYTWLLRIAGQSPSDESAQDMAAAVKEGYSDRCCVPMEHEATGERVLAHFQPTTPADEEALHGLFCAFRAIAPRLQGASEERCPDESEGPTGESISAFVDALPVTEEEVRRWLAKGWPTRNSHCHNFPHLEAGVPVQAPTTARPCLRDSLLGPRLIAKLEAAAYAERDVAAVLRILKWCQQCVAMEREKQESGARRLLQQALDGEEIDVWRQFGDATAQRLRAGVVAAGGLTPELYHYVVAALAKTQPTAALRMLQRMRDAELRVLDLTRGVALVAAQGSPEEQIRLFKEQLDEIAARRQLDADYDTNKQIEVYWKYQYTDFLHYRNAMDEKAFYEFLMDGLPDGPHSVQQLMLAAQACGPAATEEDLVVLDDALRVSAVRHFRQQLGRTAVDTAVDIITAHMPKLDISLAGSVPHFSEYVLAEGDDVATDTAALAARLKPYDTVYVLDTSFVETGETFLELGRSPRDNNGGEEGKSLVLIPYLVLAQLAESVENASSNAFISFDPALAEAVAAEPFLASQRLRALFALHQRGDRSSAVAGSGGGGSDSGDVRLLHFTECLLAHGLPREVVEGQLRLQPGSSDNDHLLLVLAMVSSLVQPSASVVLCSDDPVLIHRLGEITTGSAVAGLFRSPVGVLRTQPPAEVDTASGLINDNPVLPLGDGADFTPKLDISLALKTTAKAIPSSSPERAAESEQVSSSAVSDGTPSDGDDITSSKIALAEGAAKISEDTAEISPWLSLLLDDTPEDASSGEAAGSLVTSSSSSSPATAATSAVVQQDEETATDSAERALSTWEEELMNLYESPHDIEPVGMRMKAADDLGSVFTQFDVLEPEVAAQRALDRQARASELQHSGSGASGGRRRRSGLEREMLANRGASYKERQQLARQLSNMSGGRVPFNFRYKVVEANVNDPRNARLRRTYEEGLQKTRSVYKQRSTGRRQ